MPSRLSKKISPEPEIDSDQYIADSPPPRRHYQKRSASLRSLDGGESVFPETPVQSSTKRVRLVSESPVVITDNAAARYTLSRKHSFGSVDDEQLESTGSPVSPSKRTRRRSEKALYMTLDGQDNTDNLTVQTLKQPAKTKLSKVTEEHGPQTSRLSHAPVVAVKTEPVDMDEGLKSLSSPILISSSDDEDPTPKAKPARGKNFPSSLTKQDFSRASKKKSSSDKPAPQPTPPTSRRKGKEADTEEPIVDLPGSTQLEPLSETTVYLEDIAPAVNNPSFAVVPFDNANGPAACPGHLLHVGEDGSASPIELVAGAFDLFEGIAFESISNALRFGELRPFVNVTSVPRSRIYAEKFKNHVMWSGQNRSVIFTMLGSVQGCHIIEPTIIGQHMCKAITIVPYGEAWRKFQVFMGDLYGRGQMRGPFEYGCLLTLSGRREGYTSPDNFGMSTPVTPKKNMKAFGGSGAAASSEWYDAKLQNCIDFDKAIPIYDASKTVFRFDRDSFVGMPSLPLYKRSGKIADLPVDSLVSVFFAMSSYAKRSLGSSSTPASGASSNDVLSLNIHYVIFYGVIPRDV